LKPLRSIVLLFAAALLTLLIATPTHSFAKQTRNSVYRPEEIEWTWEVRPNHADPTLPNIALVGDSITRNYFPEVQRQLAGIANVYLFASSICVGDPRLENQLAEFVRMEGVRFKVIHFNNGLHGWDYSEDDYRKAFPAYLKAVRAMSPRAALIWTSSTPMKSPPSGASNARVETRNSIALKFILPSHIVVDDQYMLMLKHQDLYQDGVHFNETGSNIQGKQAADLIRTLLK
jgi:hypothetical protein